MKFKELDKKDTYEVESGILDYWKKENILEKTIENRKNCHVHRDQILSDMTIMETCHKIHRTTSPNTHIKRVGEIIVLKPFSSA